MMAERRRKREERQQMLVTHEIECPFPFLSYMATSNFLMEQDYNRLVVKGSVCLISSLRRSYRLYSNAVNLSRHVKPFTATSLLLPFNKIGANKL